MKVTVQDRFETKKLAEIFADEIKETGGFICLYGDIGAGKTEFVRFCIKHLGVIENVTSPSFVILNEYKSKYLPIYHFDLYRLENAGMKTIEAELTEYSKDGVLTFVEWANFGKDELPFHKIDINVTYDIQNLSDKRVFEFSANTENYKNIIKNTVEKFEGTKN